MELGVVVFPSEMIKYRSIQFLSSSQTNTTNHFIIHEVDTLTPNPILHTPHFQETLTDLRMALMAPFSRRETWAWEMPRELATSIWVLPS